MDGEKSRSERSTPTYLLSLCYRLFLRVGYGKKILVLCASLTKVEEKKCKLKIGMF